MADPEPPQPAGPRRAGRKKPRRWLRRIGIAFGVIVALLVGLVLWLREPMPEGETGEAADALAHRIETAVDREAWDRTGAVRWTFMGANHHLWDRERNLARVRWDDVEVLLRVDDRTGVARRAGIEVRGAERDELLDGADRRFINDSFWLNPLVKLFDPGVTRRLVWLDGAAPAGQGGASGDESVCAPTENGGPALLVTYGSGGRTPGDSYLWAVDAGCSPVYWRMWVSIIPIGGLKTTWEGWVRLSTGARISTVHGAGPFHVDMITDVEGAETLGDLVEGPDPFAPLVEGEVSR